MKKWICLLLTLTLLTQAVPVFALSGGAGNLTEAEAREALQLAGLVSDADGIHAAPNTFHSGMTPDETWNARMLRRWIEDLRNTRLNAVADTYQRAESLLRRMETEDPAAYDRLLRGYPGGEDLFRLSQNQSHAAMHVDANLRLQKTRLEESCVMVEQMLGLLLGGNLADWEVRRYSENIRLAARAIREIRSRIVDSTVNDVRSLTSYAAIINGTYSGDDPRCRAMHEWLGEIFRWETRDNLDAEGTVNIGTAGKTLMKRLQAAGGGSLLDGGGDAKIHIRSENELYFQYFDENAQPLQGVTVTIWDENSPDRTSASCVTDESGYAYISCENFIADEDKEVLISLQTEAASLGYQDFYASRIYMTRGEVRSEYLKKETVSEPYLYSADFQGYDIVRKEWDMLFSSANDFDFDIHLTFRNPGGQAYDEPVLHYNYYDSGEWSERTVHPTSKDGDTYVYTGPWKSLFSPDSKVRPYFTFGEKGTEALTTLLNSVQSAVDQPTYSGEEATSPLNSLLKDGLGFKFSVNLCDGLTLNLGLQLPLEKYWPKVSASPAGVMVSFGSELTDPEDGMPGNWKSASLKDYEKALNKYDNMSYLAGEKAKIGAAYDYYKQDNVELLQEAKAGFGWFGVFAGRWQKDEDFNTWLTTVSGTTGLIFTFSYSITQPFTIGPVPLYMSITFALSVGFCVGLDVEFAIKDGNWGDVRFGVFPEVTIELCFAITMTVGVGIQGIASIYVSGTICFNLAIAIAPQMKPKISPSVSAFVTVGVELLFFSMSAVLIVYPDSRASGGTLFDLFMSEARAEEAAETDEGVSQTPYRYPDLAPAAEKVLDNLQSTSVRFRVVSTDDYAFAFYMTRDTVTDTQIAWQNLTTGAGDVIRLPEGLDDFLQPYCFDAYADGENVYVVVCVAHPFMPEDSWPPDTAVFKGFMAGYPVNGDGSLGDGSAVIFTPREGLSYETLAEPHITVASMDGGLNMIASFGQIAQYGNNSAMISCAGGDMPIYHSLDDLHSGSGDTYRFGPVIPLFQGSYDFKPTERSAFVTLSEPDGSDYHTLTALELFDPVLDEAPRDSRATIPLETAHIGDFRMLQLPGGNDAWNQTVFYTNRDSKPAGDEEEGPDMARYRLQGFQLSPKETDPDYGWTVYTVHDRDYDVSLPTGKFEMTLLGTNVLLYWMNSAPSKDPDAPAAWQVCGVNYDPSTDTMSDQFVFAEFTLPDMVLNGQAVTAFPADVTVDSTGYGYLSTVPAPKGGSAEVLPASLYRFPLDLKPILDIQGLTLSETLVTPGQMVDTTMTLMNAGSLNITGYDLELVQVLDDGSEGPALETIHYDCLDTSFNTVTMADGSIVSYGDSAIFRQEDFIFSGRQHNWSTVFSKQVWRILDGIPQNPEISPDQDEYIETNVMVPGALAAYSAGIRIPLEEEWQGDILLRLRVAQINAITGLPTRPAGSGLAGRNTAHRIPNGAKQLVYRLNPATGKLELQTANLTETEQNIYAREISAPAAEATLRVEHQDIAADYRLGRGVNDEPMLDIVISNRVNNWETIALTCAVYPDGSKTPYYVSLPYYAEYVSAGKTQTISMPLNRLADPSRYSSVRVEIRGVGVEESTYVNNSFTLNLQGLPSGDFRIVKQPEDAAVQEGETAVFTTEVTGGVSSRHYTWEVRMGETSGWQRMEGSDTATLTLKGTKRIMDGWKYRCVIQDAAGKTLTTREALLTVTHVPSTGDSSNLPLYLILAAAALAVFFLLRRKRGEE